ncbi:MAG: multicopper oxidase domain-containing protein [Acidimicrobiales bacterium]|nr:multicopper oxidase domain-containing protein [Acidimicrobiales bacterium]
MTADAGAHPIVAVAEGRDQHAAAVLRAGVGEAPDVDAMPAELDGRLLSSADLRPTDAVLLDRDDPDLTIEMELTGSELDYQWGINGRAMDDPDPFQIEEGQTVRIVFRNASTMWHPMHLHGHTFALDETGARKDTVIVRPDESIAVTFSADNPGQWMVHCHNTYHLEAGMAGVVSYVR